MLAQEKLDQRSYSLFARVRETACKQWHYMSLTTEQWNTLTPFLCLRKYFPCRSLEGTFLENMVNWREDQIILTVSVPQ